MQGTRKEWRHESGILFPVGAGGKEPTPARSRNTICPFFCLSSRARRTDPMKPRAELPQ